MYVTDAEARAALLRMAEQSEEERLHNGTIIGIFGRQVRVALDGEGSGVVIAYRGAFEAALNARVQIRREAGQTSLYRVVGIASDGIGALDNNRYDGESVGEKLYYPLPLEAVNNGLYNLGENLTLTVYNFQALSANGAYVYTASQTLDLASHVPVADSRWVIVYGDVNTGILDTSAAPQTSTPAADWPDAVNYMLQNTGDALPVLAVRLDAGMTVWGAAWRVLWRKHEYADKPIIRIPAPVQPTGGTVVTDAYYQTVQQDGDNRPSRQRLNFSSEGVVQFTVSDDGTDTTTVFGDVPVMTGATDTTDGTAGLVPAPQAGDEDKLLHGDGTYRANPAAIDQFTQLTDTPSSITPDQYLLGNTGGTALVFGKPAFTLEGDTGSTSVETGDTLEAAGGDGISTAVSGDVLTVALDINSLTEEMTPATGDMIPVWDASVSAVRKVNVSNFSGGGDGAISVAEDGETPLTGIKNLVFADGTEVASVNSDTALVTPPSGGGGGGGSITVQDAGGPPIPDVDDITFVGWRVNNDGGGAVSLTPPSEMFVAPRPPVVRGITQAAGGGGSPVTVNVPANAEVGDLLIVLASGQAPATTLTGWQLLAQNAGGTGNNQSRIFAKFCVAGDAGSALSVGYSGATGMKQAHCVAVAGATGGYVTWNNTRAPSGTSLSVSMDVPSDSLVLWIVSTRGIVSPIAPIPATGTLISTSSGGDGISYVYEQAYDDPAPAETIGFTTPTAILSMAAIVLQGSTGYVNSSRVATSDYNVSNPPTATELSDAFGTPATVGSGFIAVLDDGGGDTATYLAVSNGASWLYTLMTKAT